MALEEELIANIPPELVKNIEGLITILKTLGWIFIAYLIFNIINLIINKNKKKEIEKINKNLEEIKAILKKGKK